MFLFIHCWVIEVAQLMGSKAGVYAHVSGHDSIYSWGFFVGVFFFITSLSIQACTVKF